MKPIQPYTKTFKFSIAKGVFVLLPTNFRPTKDGRVTARVQKLGIADFGNTREEAEENIADAIVQVFIVMHRDDMLLKTLNALNIDVYKRLNRITHQTVPINGLRRSSIRAFVTAPA